MDWIEILNQIVQVCIIPLLGILVTSFVKAVNLKKEQIIAQSENELTKKYVDLLANTITDCVIATNQTYVEALKDKDIFDEAAHKEALKLTYNCVMGILSDEAKKYLEVVYGDLNAYIIAKIEAEVSYNKFTKYHG